MTHEDASVVVVRESCQVALDMYEVRLVFLQNAVED